MEEIRIQEDTETSRAGRNIDINKIISRMHSYVIRRRGLSWRFVDREEEARIIVSGDRVVEEGIITVLYGPKGCGKSTLFDALAKASDQEGSDLDVVVVKRPEEAIQRSMLHLPKSLRKVAGNIARYLEDSQISSDRAVIVFTSTIFSAVFTLANYIASKLKKGRRMLIVLDEARADSIEHLSNLRQWLETFANDIRGYNMAYSEKGGSIAVVALTSDALVGEIRYVVGGKVNWALIWNLSKRASDDLISQIGLHHRIAKELGINAEKAMEILWRLAGGNPRVLERIWEKGVREWLGGEVIGRIRRFFLDMPEDRRGKALEKISDRIDNVDGIGWTDPDIWKTMIRHNIIIYIAAADKITELPSEPWIGRKEFAFQLPAYYYALKAMVKKKSWDVSPEEVIREAMG